VTLGRLKEKPTCAMKSDTGGHTDQYKRSVLGGELSFALLPLNSYTRVIADVPSNFDHG
jgi:hypothetical protein